MSRTKRNMPYISILTYQDYKEDKVSYKKDNKKKVRKIMKDINSDVFHFKKIKVGYRGFKRNEVMNQAKRDILQAAMINAFFEHLEYRLKNSRTYSHEEVREMLKFNKDKTVEKTG